MIGTTEAFSSSLRGLSKLTNFSADSPFRPVSRRELPKSIQQPQAATQDFKENVICISLKKENPAEKVADIKRQYQQSSKIEQKMWTHKKRKAEWTPLEVRNICE